MLNSHHKCAGLGSVSVRALSEGAVGTLPRLRSKNPRAHLMAGDAFSGVFDRPNVVNKPIPLRPHFVVDVVQKLLGSLVEFGREGRRGHVNHGLRYRDCLAKIHGGQRYVQYVVRLLSIKARVDGPSVVKANVMHSVLQGAPAKAKVSQRFGEKRVLLIGCFNV